MEVIVGDITNLATDAIVNAANTSLLGGSGVDGAIHKAAGKELIYECRLLGGCKIGEAKLTKGYLLPAKFIIHTVGPVWRGGIYGESELLSKCYRECIKIAVNQEFKSLAFPCISTGIYKYPKSLAATIAITTCQEQLYRENSPLKIFFCCYDRENYEIYTKILSTEQKL
jgi:O-acetyl-ADP-ribose deacetylase (regulator of RNase III)